MKSLKIDQVRIYNRALTQREIAARYAKSSVKYRNKFTFANNTNLMLTLGWARDQNTTSFDPTQNTLGFSGEPLECYGNETQVMVREKITKKEFKEVLGEKIRRTQSGARSKVVQNPKNPSKSGKSTDSELSSQGVDLEGNSPDFLQKIIQEIREIIREGQEIQGRVRK